MTGILIDTNVLVYAHDRHAPDKQRRSIDVLAALHASGRGFLGAQCLAEFFRSTTRRSRAILNAEQAASQVADLAAAWPILDLTAAVVLEAVRGCRRYQINYWDAQIWAAARLNQCGAVFSEDFDAGAVLEGVRFVNPFAEGFKLAAWV